MDVKSRLRKKFASKKAFSKKDYAWMDKHDWHPIDNKPFKKSFIAELNQIAKRGKIIRARSIYELFGK